MAKVIRTILAIIFVWVLYAPAQAQCFYIKDILVDACGTPEGVNEMVKIKIGPSNLNVSSLSITWPNNPFKGICQNSTTATLVKNWNASIKSCGHLLEPTSGVLPAGKQVLIITSTNVDPSAHSFADISDTMYVIFQCAGNTTGHFLNYSSSSATRTTKISFGASCSESVTYDAHNLVDQNGKKTGADGASVEFDTAGNATYFNNGCRPPSTPVTVNAGRDTILCPLSKLSLKGALLNVKSPKWTSSGKGSFGNDTLLSTTYTMAASDTATTLLFLSGKAACGKIIDTLSISLLPFPRVKISPDTMNACVGKGIQLSAKVSAYSSLAWSGGNGSFDNKNISNPVYTPAIKDTGSFIRLILQANGSCSPTKDTLILKVSPLPAIKAGRDTAICIGATLQLKASGNLKSVKWTSSGNGIFANDTLLSTTYKMGTHDTIPVNIYINGKSYCGTAGDTLVITPQRYPQVKISPDSMSACVGKILQLSAKASYYNTLVWSGGYGSFNNKAIASPMYTPSLKDTGKFTMLFLQGSGNCAPARDTLILKVNPIPALKAGRDTTLCSGSTLPLKATTNLKSIKWTSSGNGIFANDTLPNTTYTLGTDDTIKVSLYLNGSSYCGNASDTLIVNVLKRPTVKISNIALAGCLGKGMQLSAKASNYSSLLWSGGNGSFSNKTISNPVYTPSAKDTGASIMLYLQANGNCSPARDTLQIKVLDKPTVKAGRDTILCRGQALPLRGSSNASTLQWAGGSGSFGNSSSLNTTYTPGAKDTAAYYLILTATNNCASSLDSFKVSPKTKTRLHISPPDTACIGKAIQLSGSSTSSPYNWYGGGKGTFVKDSTLSPAYTPAMADTGKTYIYLHSSDVCGNIKDSAILYTRPPGHLGLTAITSGLCRGATVIIKANSTAGVLSWASSGNGVFNKINANTVSYVPGTNDTVSAKLYCKLSTACNIIADSLTINYLPLTHIVVDAVNNACPGQAVLIHFHPALDSAMLNGGSGLYKVLNDSTFIYYSAYTESLSNIILSGRDKCARVATSFSISFAPAVKAAFSYSPTTLQTGDMITFQNNSTGASRYQWDFGDNQGYSHDKDPVYTYTHYGYKAIRLVAYNDYCSDTASLPVTVNNNQYFILPNAFSPNDDGINDLFAAKGSGIRIYHILIYNRWGELVYESTDLTKGWDGKFHGKDAEEGIYHYQASIGFDPNGFKMYSGTVSLIR